jgi:hypothetical protein
MKNLRSKKNDFQIEYNRNFYDGNKIIKTTNINILLNRIRQENKSKSKKTIFLLFSIISILSFISFVVFVN